MSFDGTIAIVGLGYVGLPLAVAFGKHYRTIGFDINPARVSELEGGVDSTLEVTSSELVSSQLLTFSAQASDIAEANIFIVTVPTPIDRAKAPDLSPLISASTLIGSVLKHDDIVIYESTVYPGATEEVCVPVLEDTSGLVFNRDFFVGYSPERINPGDKTHRLADITKVTSGSNSETADRVDALYSSIIRAGTHRAPSIKVAEAAKVIENTQRDVNIALVNELAIIFDKLGIDTHEVLRASATKWNFLPFQPGLVGGHCIGVDPFYLTHRAQVAGHNPELILAGRRLNDGMAKFISERFVKELVKRKVDLASARILIMGLTFKEDCPDLRNSKIFDVLREVSSFGLEVDVLDPCCSRSEASDTFGVSLISNPQQKTYDGIIIAVPHSAFIDMGIEEIRKFGKGDAVIYDVKAIFDSQHTDLRL